jgi:transcriptional regulator with XRE-family HTH domain
MTETLSQPFSAALKAARSRCKVSQLELSLRLGVSQRHVSFVEGGKSKPSRTLLAQWLEALELPLALRNELMLQAGFAPLYTAGAAAEGGEAVAHAALARLLAAHDPMPAMVLNAQWQVLQTNAGAARLLGLLMPVLAAQVGAQLAAFQAGRSPAPSMVDAMLHPQGLFARMLNLHEVGPSVLAHLRQDAVHEPALRPRVLAVQAMLKAKLGAKRIERLHPLEPVVTSRFDTALGPLAFFSMFTTFGSPQSIGLASLRVEHLFAADEQTARAMGQLAKV